MDFLLSVVALFTQGNEGGDGFDRCGGEGWVFDETRGLWCSGVEDRVACELFDFAGELGDDGFSGSFANFRELDEGFGVFVDDRQRDLCGGIDHGAEGFLRSDTFDGGEDFEKASIGDARESDESWDETGALALRFEIEVGVEGDGCVDL